MRVVCAWCNKYIKDKEPLEDKRISHGICGVCYEKEVNQIDEHYGGEDGKTRLVSRPPK